MDHNQPISKNGTMLLTMLLTMLGNSENYLT